MGSSKLLILPEGLGVVTALFPNRAMAACLFFMNGMGWMAATLLLLLPKNVVPPREMGGWQPLFLS